MINKKKLNNIARDIEAISKRFDRIDKKLSYVVRWMENTTKLLRNPNDEKIKSDLVVCPICNAIWGFIGSHKEKSAPANGGKE